MLTLPIDVNTEESLLSFRSKIATLFDLKLNEFNILTKSGIVDVASCDQMAMRLFNIESAKNLTCERVYVGTDEREKPTRIISNDRTMLSKLT